MLRTRGNAVLNGDLRWGLNGLESFSHGNGYCVKKRIFRIFNFILNWIRFVMRLYLYILGDYFN